MSVSASLAVCSKRAPHVHVPNMIATSPSLAIGDTGGDGKFGGGGNGEGGKSGEGRDGLGGGGDGEGELGGGDGVQSTSPTDVAITTTA
eukprot:scaffold42680_cov34-Tisochrysis_lutea.AAC.2